MFYAILSAQKKFYPKSFWVKQGATQCYQAFLFCDKGLSIRVFSVLLTNRINCNRNNFKSKIPSGNKVYFSIHIHVYMHTIVCDKFSYSQTRTMQRPEKYCAPFGLVDSQMARNLPQGTSPCVAGE